MQEVDHDYTRVSLETANRVKSQLENGVVGRNMGYRLQGSVPCNIHIRGVSDVDLLALDQAFFTYDSHGCDARSGYYDSPYHVTPVQALTSLRTQIENVLDSKYPAATVDKTGAKAVKISGGSLPRPVDVVPSHWHNTADYQQSSAEHDRGVNIFDKKLQKTLHNMPFRHIKLVTDRCEGACLGGLKKSIRLCKHVKADAIEDGKDINFSSFDIAATMYHANTAALTVGSTYELAILAETQRWLDYLACNFDYARTLNVPDGSRKIFDSDAKLNGMRRLSIEMDELLKEVAKEQSPQYSFETERSLPDSRNVVTGSYIPFFF
ncbi:hypothetical protein [Beijerinckia sp. L45]|uniref:hypothetical protein n=1 Tax=Beijerinckia sp. L45 TaxID=1641855 RepID=UPI00131B1673|nr:hypothetical protein [Beijerinckia sp. L45]